MGLTCGTVTGAYMPVGLKYGKIRADDNEAKEKTYALVQEVSKQFVARNKSLNCTELLSCDLGTAAGREKAKEQNLATTICEKLVRDAAEILKELL